LLLRASVHSVARRLRRARPAGSAGRRSGVLRAAVVIAGVVAMGLVATPASAAGCTPGAINVVAHPDDDLYFVNPAILRDIRAGLCSTTVYVTAGDAGRSDSYYKQRELGVRAAYAKMAGVADKWTTSLALVGTKILTRVTLKAKPAVSLYFLQLPDGFADGSGSARTGNTSLEQLYTGKISSLRAVGGLRQAYTRSGLVDTLGRLMSASTVTSIRTLDYLGEFGDGDHSDHHAVGRFVNDARTKFRPTAPIDGYLGYTSTRLPANVSGADLQAKMDALFAYAPYDPGTCRSAVECSYSDAGEWLARSRTNRETPPPPPAVTLTGTNVAGAATVTASTQNAADGQTAAKAIDGVVDGYPGDHTAEWATSGERAGGWLQLAWAGPVQLNGVVLFDRPNTYDQVTGATLTFSDGSTVTVPALDNAGAATTVSFPARSTTTLRITLTSVRAGTANAGLAEVQAWGTGPVIAPPPPPVTLTGTNVAGAATVTASTENAADGQTAAKAIDGVVDGYPGDHTAEWATSGEGAGGWLQLAWAGPVQLNGVVLFDRPNTQDQVTGATLTFSDGSTVTVPALDNAGAATTVSFPARSTTTLRITLTSVRAGTANAGLAEIQAWGTGPVVTSTRTTAAAPTAVAPAPATTGESVGAGVTTPSAAPASSTPAGSSPATGSTPAGSSPATSSAAPSSAPAGTVPAAAASGTPGSAAAAATATPGKK
jgi:LmbE family N-acetylglucosaminyl deacetylase